MDILAPGSDKVREVCHSYSKMVLALYGKFSKPTLPRAGGKMFDNCLQVSAICERLGITLRQYMFSAFKQYGRDWIRDVFKMEYVPFALATSEKTRERVEAIFQKALKASPKESVEVYLKLLEGLSKEDIKFAINSGFCGSNEEVKKILREKTIHD